jgi:hypothetical protein
MSMLLCFFELYSIDFIRVANGIIKFSSAAVKTFIALSDWPLFMGWRIILFIVYFALK